MILAAGTRLEMFDQDQNQTQILQGVREMQRWAWNLGKRACNNIILRRTCFSVFIHTFLFTPQDHLNELDRRKSERNPSGQVEVYPVYPLAHHDH